MIRTELRKSIRHWHPRVAELPSGIKGDYCGNCGVEWPCVQAALLDELEAAEAKIEVIGRAAFTGGQSPDINLRAVMAVLTLGRAS